MLVCPSCQLDNEEGAVVCYSCGKNLGGGWRPDTVDVLGEEPTPSDSLPAALPQEERSWEEAIAECDEAIRLNPSDADAYFNRGVAYDNVGQFDRAIGDYDQAIRLDPDNLDTYLHRGLAYSDLGQFQNAIQDYNELISDDPEDVEAYFNRGVAYFKMGQYQASFDDYNEVIRIDPEDVEVYPHLAVTATLLGKDEEAEEFVELAVELGNAPAFLEVVIDELKKRR